MLEHNKLLNWPGQPVKASHAFAWPPSADEDLTSPPSSSVGPRTPEPEPQLRASRQSQLQAHDNPALPKLGDLIDLGPADNFAAGDSDDGLPPPLQPDTKEVNLVSYVIDQ